MKNVFKKISAIVMAFSILGSGSIITQYTNSKTGNTLVAIAACQYHDGSILNGKIISNYKKNKAEREGKRYCNCCGQFTGYYTGRGKKNIYWENGKKYIVLI